MLINTFKGILKNNVSFLMILLGAICFFFTNIILKCVFTPKDYGLYSIFITYFSGVYLLGILGSEQGFLRFSYPLEKNIIATHKIQLKLLYLIIFINTIIFSVLFKVFYSQTKLNFIILILATSAMILLLFLFNVLRLNSNFVVSQFYSNYWKYIIFSVSILFYFFNLNNINLFFNIILLNIIIITIIALVHIRSKIKFKYINEISKKETYLSALHFSLAIFAFTLLIFSDRFIIEKKYSIESFGDYFYLTNFFLAPFSILQNYIGFKQLIKFKTDFNITDFNKFNKRVIFFGIFLSLILLVFSYIIDYNNIVNLNINKNIIVILLLLITGIIRIYSSSILSAFEAKTDIHMLRHSNVLILSITTVLIFFIIFFIEKIEIIIFLYIVIWYLRSLVHKTLLIRQIKKS